MTDFRTIQGGMNGEQAANEASTADHSRTTRWQPIETAPKDGTIIDLWLRYADGYGKRIPDGFWQADKEPLFFDSNRTEGWVAANCGYDGCDGFADDPEDGDVVTHWMPLPDPPNAPPHPRPPA